MKQLVNVTRVICPLHGILQVCDHLLHPARDKRQGHALALASELLNKSPSCMCTAPLSSNLPRPHRARTHKARSPSCTAAMASSTDCTLRTTVSACPCTLLKSAKLTSGSRLIWAVVWALTWGAKKVLIRDRMG